MSKSFSKRRNEFVGQALERHRLAYALQRGFYTIPADIGYVFDYAIGIHGTMPGTDKNQEDPMCGPIGFSLGILFSASGLILGHIINAAVSTPAVMGSGLDWALGLDNIAAARGKDYNNLPRIFWVTGFHFCFKMLNLCHVLMSAYCYKPTDSMSGAFGMLFGLIPELLRFIAITLLSIAVTLVDSLRDALCAVIDMMAVHSGKPTSLKPDGQAKPTNGEPDIETGHPEHQEPTPPLNEYSTDQDINEALNKGLDLYYILFEEKFSDQCEVALSEDVVKAAFRTQARKHHADKDEDDRDDNIMQNLKLARDILLDVARREEYNLLAETYLQFEYPSNTI